MNCSRCGTALSEVKETRKYLGVFLTRTRVCFNGHTFKTYEVNAGSLDRRRLRKYILGDVARRAARKRVVAALRDPRSAAVVAVEHGCTPERIRQIRRAVK